MERIIFEEIQAYFDVNNVNTDYQHAYRPGHFTCMALTQMTDDRRSGQNNWKLAVAVLLVQCLMLSIILCC